MVTVNEWWTELTLPFTPGQTHWRIGATRKDKKAAIALAYVDARDVMDRLDAVCGPAGWQCTYSHAMQKTICDLKVLCPMGSPDDDIDNCEWQWITKADGAGDTQVESEKGAISDALKRAAVRFGIGRYLYGMDSPWVDLEDKFGRPAIIQSEYAKLDDLLMKTIGKILDGSRNEKEMLRCFQAQIRRLQTPELVDAWIEENKVFLGKFLKTYREELWNVCKHRKLELQKVA